MKYKYFHAIVENEFYSLKKTNSVNPLLTYTGKIDIHLFEEFNEDGNIGEGITLRIELFPWFKLQFNEQKKQVTITSVLSHSFDKIHLMNNHNDLFKNFSLRKIENITLKEVIEVLKQNGYEEHKSYFSPGLKEYFLGE